MPNHSSPSCEILRNVWIPMRDGVRLAGNLYRPAGAGRHPCIVNYMPYHKDGRGGLGYADTVHRHFVQRGYTVMAIDFRGLGCSEGVNPIPFDSQEGRDGHDAVEWIAAQDWCDGKVGMWGTSYGGITSLKTAAERPPHLGAIVPIHATTDNSKDFLTLGGLGGCPNGFWANGDWGPRMIGYNLTPPLAADPDGRLARLWAERLEQFRPWPLEWYEHPEDGARWAERAIPVERIAVPTYAVCGWQDFYTDMTVDYFNRITAPKKLLMGPWKHVFPNQAPFEPVNFLEIMVRWWDRWLKGEANGIEAGPPVSIYVHGAGWRQEEEWPLKRNENCGLSLRPDQLSWPCNEKGEPPEVYLARGEDVHGRPYKGIGHLDTYRYNPTVGLDSIGFDPWTTAVLDEGDHNADDARSCCFTALPLEDDWELCGNAKGWINFETAVPGLTLVAKLCDVHPDGQSRLVTMGWQPRAMGSLWVIDLRHVAHVFQRGHRIRVSIALADFPRIWPTPQAAEIRLFATRLFLPRTPSQQPALPAPVFPPPGESLKSPAELESTQTWRVSRELVHRSAALESFSTASYRLEDCGTIAYGHHYVASVSEKSPADAEIRSDSKILVQRPSGKVEIQTTNVFTPASVKIEAEIERDGSVIFRKKWEATKAGHRA